MKPAQLNVSFASKYVPTVKQPSNRVITDSNHTQVLATKRNATVPAMLMVNALKAQTLTETPAAALAKMVDGATNGTAKRWSYICKPEGGDILCCELNGKKHLLESIRTDETYEKDGAKYYKMDFSLTVKGGGEEDKVYKLSGEEYTKAANQIEQVIMPVIEEQYGLGKGLELTNIITDLASKTVDKEIEWKQIDANIGFGDGLSIEASGAVEGYLKDGTRVNVLEQVTSQLFSVTRTSFIGLEKPGLPPQLIKIGSDKEEKAYELFGGAFKIIQKEQELQQAMEALNADRDALKQMITDFKEGKEV